MSNFLAIATVTATLSRYLQTAAGNDVPGAAVTTLRPDGTGSGLPATGVNIYLYQVVPNPYGRNDDLPTRRSNGAVVQRPRAALDLHYLLTFYGDEGTLETQRLLGSVVRAIHAQSVLTRPQIQYAIANPPHSAYLANSNLADEIELVKFTPLLLTLEELSKLWSVFFQIDYALSIAYQASVVFVESEDVPQTALPVREQPKVYVMPFNFPSITTVEPQMIEFNAGAVITIRGSNLRAGDPTVVTTVHLNDLDSSLDQPTRADRLVAHLPANARAGVNAVQVVQRLLIGTPPTLHRGFESNVAALVVQPKLNSSTFGTFGTPASPGIKVDVTPVVGAKQRVSLLLNQFSDPPLAAPLAFTLQAGHRKLDTDPIIFDAPKVPVGTYLVRIRVDGADSNLIIDKNSTHTTFNIPIAPTVVVL